MYLLSIFLLFYTLFPGINGLCQPGCECRDEERRVDCRNITDVPILLHPMLTQLFIRDSPMLRLDPVSIGLYQELEILDLSNNSIAAIPSGFFSGLKKLKELKLGQNRLKVLDERIFGINDLQDNNGLQAHLERLDLSNNHIERIVPNVFASSSFDSLALLNLSANQLHFVQPAAFSGLSQSLRILDLSRNRFSRLQSGFFNETSSLVELNLSANILSELPAGLFSTQRHLRKLDVSSNLIATVNPRAFSGLYSLRSLNLAHNLLSSIGQSDNTEDDNASKEDSRESYIGGSGGLSSHNWEYLPELEVIDVSSNPLKTLKGDSFRGLYSLRELIMEDMPQLKTIETDALAGVVSLEKLRMSSCPMLTHIDRYVFGKKLKLLDLSHNQLSVLYADMLDWKALKWVNLAGNRWNCDCELLDFLPAVLRNVNGAGSGAAYCAEPDHLLNAKIVDIQNSASCTPISQPFITAIMLVSLLTTLTLIALLILLCCCRTHDKKSLLLPKCCSPASTSNGSNNHSRVPLYATGSSFTESLIYEKGYPTVKTEPLMPTFVGHRGESQLIRSKFNNPNTANSNLNMDESLSRSQYVQRTKDTDDTGSGYYYSILPVQNIEDPNTLRHPISRTMSQNYAFHSDMIGYPPSLSSDIHPTCPIAKPPYLLHNRSMQALNQAVSMHGRGATRTRPPSFTAPPPPMVPPSEEPKAFSVIRSDSRMKNLPHHPYRSTEVL
ncbi:leucine rich repeat domain-containing protein [Ditylenchus destructor]|nr:leucine rich repeat domain-containing protein [Ditylenchus destructor]